MREATIKDTDVVSKMLYNMYNEVQPKLASHDIKKYISLFKEHLKNDFVYIDKQNRGFFIVRDVTSPVIKRKMYDGVSVYIKPEYRKTRVLKDMYDFMFKTFDGTIIGYTDINSEHNKVLQKRHETLGFIYKLNRPEKDKAW